MFSQIFLFEIKRWVKNPAFYIYAAVFFGFAILVMGTNIGLFDNVTVTASDPVYANSPLKVSGMLNALSIFVYFLLPTIVGGAIYRDYKYNVHQVLYSYSVDKTSYLSAKFLSGLVVTVAIVMATTLGFFAVQLFPNVNKELLGPNHLWSYMQAYVYLIIPNLLLFGAIVFALVTFTRNIYIGFIFIIFLFVLDAFLAGVRNNMDNEYLAALIDPFGFEALHYETKYWTVEEQNFLNIPFSGAVLYNRLIWSSLGILVLFSVYATFDFSYAGFQWRNKKKGKRITKDNFGSIITINLPKVTLDYSFLTRLRTAWNLSNGDFKFVVRNWIFIIMMIFAVLMVVVVTSISGEIYGTETYPVTWQILSTMGGIYGFFLTMIIYLFSGMLVQRSSTARMNLLVDATATPNWVLLLSKVIALIKVAILVLGISMLTGIGYQLARGFFQIEIGHYAYELFVLDLLKYLVIILFAFFVHAFFKNYYVGFFVCLLVMMGIPMLSRIGIEQSIFKFNQGPAYTYSDMNGYGAVRHYIWYKVYWLLFAGVLFGMTLLFWRRGIISNVRDRLAVAKARFRPAIWIPVLGLSIAFVGLGYAIYYQNNVAEDYVSNKMYENSKLIMKRNTNVINTMYNPVL